MSSDEERVYRFDAERAPDSEYEAGELRLLLAENVGRLLDDRRTPIRVVEVNAQDGMFEVEILAFEDRGKRWRVALEDVSSYQFVKGSSRPTSQRATGIGGVASF